MTTLPASVKFKEENHCIYPEWNVENKSHNGPWASMPSKEKKMKANKNVQLENVNVIKHIEVVQYALSSNKIVCKT